jgi:hypothetical protein
MSFSTFWTLGVPIRKRLYQNCISSCFFEVALYYQLQSVISTVFSQILGHFIRNLLGKDSWHAPCLKMSISYFRYILKLMPMILRSVSPHRVFRLLRTLVNHKTHYKMDLTNIYKENNDMYQGPVYYCSVSQCFISTSHILSVLVSLETSPFNFLHWSHMCFQFGTDFWSIHTPLGNIL